MSNEDIKNNELEQNEEVEAATDEAEVDTTEASNGQESEQQETETEESAIAKLEQELASTKDSLLRKAAELENVRKRVQRERAALYEDAKVAALQDFLPISEDIDRVLNATEEYEVDENFTAGVKLVAGKFEELFSKYGVEAINQTGIPFDVNLHDALLRQPAPYEKTGSDTVLQILENGSQRLTDWNKLLC